MEHLDNEYYSALKTGEVPSQEKTWRTLKCPLLCEGKQSEKATHMCEPSYLTFWKRQYYKENQKDEWLPEVRREGGMDHDTIHKNDGYAPCAFVKTQRRATIEHEA